MNSLKAFKSLPLYVFFYYQKLIEYLISDVLKDTTTKFMSEARTYIQDAVGKMKKPVSRGTYRSYGLWLSERHAPMLPERWSKKERRASRKPKPSGLSKRAGGKPGPGQGPSKGGKDMMDPKSKKEQFVAKTLALLKKVLREDTASHMETEQFDGGCSQV